MWKQEWQRVIETNMAQRAQNVVTHFVKMIMFFYMGVKFMKLLFIMGKIVFCNICFIFVRQTFAYIFYACVDIVYEILVAYK